MTFLANPRNMAGSFVKALNAKIRANPTLSYIYDNSVFGFTGPIDGFRQNTTVELSPAMGGKGISYQKFKVDLRKYHMINRDYSLAGRLFFGTSTGQNPQKYYLGGMQNWLLGTGSTNGVNDGDTNEARWRNVILDSQNKSLLQDIYFSEFAYPLRGARFSERFGTNVALANLEFRFPLIQYLQVGFPFKMTLGNILGHVFMDIGAAWDDKREFEAKIIGEDPLSDIAVIQIFGRLQRNHPEVLSGTLKELLDVLRSDLKKIAETSDYQTCYELAQAQRRKLLKISKQTETVTPLEARLLKTAHEMLSEIVLILRANNTLIKGHASVLKAPEHLPYRDPLIGLATGLRTFLVFNCGALLWLYTGSPAAIMVMIMPVIFSIMFARMPPAVVKQALKRMLMGVAVAIPVAIFYALNLLAQSSGDYGLLILVLSAPYFLGLMAISQRSTLPYGLGFCIPFTLLVQPANDMTRPLSVDYTLSAAIAIVVGVSLLYWIFRLITGPGVQTMQRRLLHATRRDLQRLIEQEAPAHWYNARMGDRLLRLTSYDKEAASDARVITDLGLTGLNLGHTSIRVRNLVQTVTDKDLSVILKHWQYVLADTFIEAAKGKTTERFRQMCDSVLAQVRQDANGPAHLTLIEGIFDRLDLTFQRTAKMVREKNTEVSHSAK